MLTHAPTVDGRQKNESHTKIQESLLQEEVLSGVEYHLPHPPPSLPPKQSYALDTASPQFCALQIFPPERKDITVDHCRPNEASRHHTIPA